MWEWTCGEHAADASRVTTFRTRLWIRYTVGVERASQRATVRLGTRQDRAHSDWDYGFSHLPATCAMSRSWVLCVFYCGWRAQRAAAMESLNRVAYLHIPKTGGTSVDWSLGFTPSIAKSMCRVGHGPGSGAEICDCRQAECLQPAQVAVMEWPHVQMARLTSLVKNATWLWLAAIREPESWFYSAAGQMCTDSRFSSNPVCLTNGTVAPYDAEWFKTTQVSLCTTRLRLQIGNRRCWVTFFSKTTGWSAHFLI